MTGSVTDRPRMPRIGVSFRGSDALCPNGIVDLIGYARLAEELGFDDFDAADQVLLDDDPDAMPSGSWRWGVDSDWADPLTLLAGVATVTRSITLTTSILIAPLRPAVVSAKMLSTVDQLSAGRLRVGVGAGWQRSEFEAAGVPHAGRTARMVDTVGAWRALWEQGPASFSSETVWFENMWSRPGAYRGRRIPVLFAGPPGLATAERIARLGDGWNPLPRYRDELREGRRVIEQAFRAVGRDPLELMVRIPLDEARVQQALAGRDGAGLRQDVRDLGAAGVTDVKVYVAGLTELPDDVPSVMTWLAEALLSKNN